MNGLVISDIPDGYDFTSVEDFINEFSDSLEDYMSTANANNLSPDTYAVADYCCDGEIITLEVSNPSDTFEIDGDYGGVTQSSTTDSGNGAIFDINIDSGTATITIVDGGQKYIVGEVITIDKADIDRDWETPP